jgi:hypothetical protein
MNWIVENWDGLVAVLLGLHGLALAVVNLTDTPDPNDTSSKVKAVLAKLYPFIEKAAGLGAKAKQLPGEGAK